MSMTTEDPSIRIRNAIKSGNLFIVKRLLNRFPELIDNIDSNNGWTNLHYAAYYNRADIASLLLSKVIANSSNSYNQHTSTSGSFTIDSNFENNKNNNNSNSTISNGSRSPHGSRGSDSSSKSATMSFNNRRTYMQITDEEEIKLTFDNQTVLHLAALNNSVETLILLLDYFNVCIDQRDSNGYTPSHICCIHDHYNCLEFLLESGAYANIQDNDGNTPLHLAMNHGYLNCIELLINANADDTLLNNKGWAPLELATTYELQASYKALKQKWQLMATNNNNTAKYSIHSDTLTPVNQFFNESKHSSETSSISEQSIREPPTPIVSTTAEKSPSISPKKLPNVSSNNSPNSKRSSMSKRTFRSNSTASEKPVSASSSLMPMFLPMASSALTSTNNITNANANPNSVASNQPDFTSPIKRNSSSQRNHSLSNASSVITTGSNASQESFIIPNPSSSIASSGTPTSTSASASLSISTTLPSNVLIKSKKTTPTTSRAPSFSLKNSNLSTASTTQSQGQYTTEISNLQEMNKISQHNNSRMLQNLNNSSSDSVDKYDGGAEQHGHHDELKAASKLLSIPISSLRARRPT